MTLDQSIFKAYDIRGVVPDQVNEQVAEQIGKAYARWLQERNQKIENRNQFEIGAKHAQPILKIVVGRDVRLHSADLSQALIRGLISQSIDVVDVGLITTPMLYFIVGSADFSGGIIVTASHNPREFNGFKLVREKAIAISGDSGIQEIGQLAASQNFPNQEVIGQVIEDDFTDRYVNHLQTFVKFKNLKPAKIVVNPNFGASSMILKKLAKTSPVKFIYLNAELDGAFPKGKPDPMLEENRAETAALVRSQKADFAAAFDADGDRVFFFDENGQFVNGYFTTALLAQAMLADQPAGSKIIHDPRLTWATIDTVKALGGVPLINKVGHSFFKERMRLENAIFAGENSGHYYFRDNFFADDGLLAFLIIWQFYSQKNSPFSQLLKPLRQKYFVSDEINFVSDEPAKLIDQIGRHYSEGEHLTVDGLSVEYPDWRFNLRSSNTEPLVRLNLEAKSQTKLNEKLTAVRDLIKSFGN